MRMTTRRKPGRRPGVTGDVVKTSVKIRRPLWLKARRTALGQGTDLAIIVNDALTAYLKRGR